jgi:hypothetical protein
MLLLVGFVVQAPSTHRFQSNARATATSSTTCATPAIAPCTSLHSCSIPSSISYVLLALSLYHCIVRDTNIIWLPEVRYQVICDGARTSWDICNLCKTSMGWHKDVCWSTPLMCLSIIADLNPYSKLKATCVNCCFVPIDQHVNDASCAGVQPSFPAACTHQCRMFQSLCYMLMVDVELDNYHTETAL